MANDFNQELPASPGSRVYVTEQVTEVTEQVTSGLEKQTGNAFYQGIEQREKALIADCEKTAGYRCQVYSFHGGLEYYLIKQLEIRDVRLVYNPAGSIGKYGGDIDNWMWPRHTGDFSFYRAYVGKDGKPADFSEDNVPYQPKSFLTAIEVENQFQWTYPNSLELREKLMEIIKQTAAEGGDARIKYESTLAGLANYAKNFTSMIEFYGKSSMLSDRKQREAQLATWINKDKQRQEQYGNTLAELDTLVTESQEYKHRDLILSYMRYSSLMPTARRLYRLAHEKMLDDMYREPGYQQRDMPRFQSGLERMDRRYDTEVDRAILLEMLTRYAALPISQRLPALDKVFSISKTMDKAALASRLQAMYENTELENMDVRLAWMEKSVNDFEESDDPFIQTAVAMYETDRDIEQQRKDLSGKFMKLRPRYMQAVIAFNRDQGMPVYADANSSLRVTIGHVKGYSPADGLLAKPFTRLEGIVAKDTAVEPFNSPSAQLELIAQQAYGDFYHKPIESVPVNFLSTLDVTGGNSGSPTLNGRAELVGLLFDGVYESIIGDWGYDDQTNRAISVDSRYMLWVMKYLDKADRLLDEMEVVYNE